MGLLYMCTRPGQLPRATGLLVLNLSTLHPASGVLQYASGLLGSATWFLSPRLSPPVSIFLSLASKIATERWKVGAGAVSSVLKFRCLPTSPLDLLPSALTS